MKAPHDRWTPLFARYRQHLLVHGYSVRTLANTQSGLNRWTQFAAEVRLADPQAVTAAVVSDFQKWLFYQPLESGVPRLTASQNRVLSLVKGFFAFLHQERFLAHNPAREMKLAREPDALPKNILTPQEARRILGAPDLSTPSGYRDRAVLEVLYATGLRRAELLALELPALNLEEGLVRVNRGKGGKDRVVPLTRAAIRFLENYLRAVRPQLLRGRVSKKVFVSVKHGYDLGGWGLEQMLKRYARQARVKKKVTPHLWRHTCATHLLQNNANLRHVQALLGHASIATTERYLRLSIADLKEAHRRHHPREKQARSS